MGLVGLLVLGALLASAALGWLCARVLGRKTNMTLLPSLASVTAIALAIGAFGYFLVDLYWIKPLVADEIGSGQRTMRAGIMQVLAGGLLFVGNPVAAAVGCMVWRRADRQKRQAPE